jgi:Spy/CpxP family protein refolding chaperone
MRFSALLAIGLLAALPTLSMAQTADEQQACVDDAFQHCGHAIPDHDRVAACLSQNFNRISQACRNVMQRYSRSQQNPRDRVTNRGNESR